jgi:hypothetical protein
VRVILGAKGSIDFALQRRSKRLHGWPPWWCLACCHPCCFGISPPRGWTATLAACVMPLCLHRGSCDPHWQGVFPAPLARRDP